ncbi:endonuclease-reverse transcriptase [Plakobranchus ocellatus]|uniref:Endonuclease-reverse transcriptase n=1 Tax=Plakobranchus ocellatus TaxID=259542 RepID=A0AAV4ACJ0_9GAST|nr:endonuclease-reverse transcriptase [Plakobranchus ocellatus]
MLRIPWTAKKTNERVLNKANKRRSLVRTIRKRPATFLGHVMRRGKLEHLVTTGKFEGKRGRGRQRRRYWMDWPHGLDQEKCQIYWPPSKIGICGGT